MNYQCSIFIIIRFPFLFAVKYKSMGNSGHAHLANMPMLQITELWG